MTLREQLIEFLQRKWPMNRWIDDGIMQVYLRQSRRAFSINKPIMVPCLDIATVDINDPAQRSKGRFTAFLKEAEEVCRERRIPAIYIENVLDERFELFFVRNNYDMLDQMLGKSFVKYLGEGERT